MPTAYSELDLTHKVGDTFRRPLTLSQRETELDPWEPINLTGYQVVFGVAFEPGWGVFKLYRTDDPDPYLAITDPLNGKVLINVPGAETRTWAEYRLFKSYEVTLIAPDGTRTSILTGTLTLIPEVVRD